MWLLPPIAEGDTTFFFSMRGQEVLEVSGFDGPKTSPLQRVMTSGSSL